MIKKIDTPLSLFYDFIIEGNTIYFPLANYNALCKGSLIDGRIEIIDAFPDIPPDKRETCMGIYKFKDYLLCEDSISGNSILVYNILQHRFSKLSTKKNNIFFSGTVFEKNNYVYIVSAATADIYKIDLQKNSLQCFTCNEYVSDDVQMGSIVRIGNSIFMPLNYKKVMLIFELEKEKFECYKYPENITNIYGLSHQGDKLWIIGEDKKIYTWSVKEREAYVYAGFPDYIEPSLLEAIYHGHSFINKDILWIFPLKTTIILKYNILTGQLEKLDVLDEEEKKAKAGQSGGFDYDIVKNVGDKVFFLSFKTRILYELDLITSDIQNHRFPIVNMFNGQFYPMPVDGKMYEDSYINGLDLLLESIAEYSKDAKVMEKGNVGKAINKYINNDSAR